VVVLKLVEIALPEMNCSVPPDFHINEKLAKLWG
jgi:hypothetical protein